jgi:hypothetical protein
MKSGTGLEHDSVTEDPEGIVHMHTDIHQGNPTFFRNSSNFILNDLYFLKFYFTKLHW